MNFKQLRKEKLRVALETSRAEELKLILATITLWAENEKCVQNIPGIIRSIIPYYYLNNDDIEVVRNLTDSYQFNLRVNSKAKTLIIYDDELLNEYIKQTGDNTIVYSSDSDKD